MNWHELIRKTMRIWRSIGSEYVLLKWTCCNCNHNKIIAIRKEFVNVNNTREINAMIVKERVAYSHDSTSHQCRDIDVDVTILGIS